MWCLKMGRVGDIVVGVVLGGVVWIVLNMFLSFMPILGWIISAIAGGYVAGRFGGMAAAVILALLTPLAIGAIGLILMPIFSMFIPAMILGIGLIAIVVGWSIVNLIFVGVGGYVGSKNYKPKE